MRAVENVFSVTSLRAPAYGQHVLKGWLGPDEAWIAERIAAFAALRKQTTDRLARVPWLKVHPQDGTAYLWGDVCELGLPDIEIGRTLARDAAVLVSMGYQFGPSSNGFIRICYARGPVGWAAALGRMIEALEARAR